MRLRPAAFRPSGSKIKAVSFHSVLPLLVIANEAGEVFVWDVDADAIIFEDNLQASDDRAGNDALLRSLAERAPGAYSSTGIRPPPPPRGAAAGAPRAVLLADADAVASQLAAQQQQSSSGSAAPASAGSAGATAAPLSYSSSDAEAVRACKGLKGGRRWLCVAADARLSLRDISSSSSSSSSSTSNPSSASLELGRGAFDSRPLTALALLCRCAPELLALQGGGGANAAIAAAPNASSSSSSPPEGDSKNLTPKQQLQHQRSLLRPTASNVAAALDRSASLVASAAAAAAAAAADAHSAASTAASWLNPTLVVGSASGSLFLVSLASAAAAAATSSSSSLAPFARLTGGHKGAVTAVLTLASPTDSGDALLSAAADGCVALWCPSSSASLATAAAARGVSSGLPPSSAAGAAAAALATAAAGAATSAAGAAAAAVGAVTYSPSSSLLELAPAAVFRAHDGPVTSAVLLRAPGQGPGRSGGDSGMSGGPLRLATAGDREVALWELGSWRPLSKSRPFASPSSSPSSSSSSSSSSSNFAVDSLAVAGPGLAPGAPAGLEPGLLLVSGDDASGVFAARAFDSTAIAASRVSTADLSLLLPRGSKKVPKIYRLASHPSSDAVAVAGNAGVLVLRGGEGGQGGDGGTGAPPLSPLVAALNNPSSSSSAGGGCSYAAAHGRYLWFCSFAAGWREDERGRRSPTADLRRRCPVAELPSSFASSSSSAPSPKGRRSQRPPPRPLGPPQLSSSSCGRFVCVLWPEVTEFVVYERPAANFNAAANGGGTPRSGADAEAPWPRVGEGKAAAAAWADGGVPRLALLSSPPPVSSSSASSLGSSRSRGKGSKAAAEAAAAAETAAANAAAAANGPSVDVVEFAGGGEAGFVVALDVARKVSKEARPHRRVAVGLHGGAMLGVVTVPAAGGGEEEGEGSSVAELSLLPWAASDGSSPDDDTTPPLPAPAALAWSPNTGGLALSYPKEGGVTLLATSPRLEPFASLPVPGVTAMLWGSGSSGGGGGGGGVGGGGNFPPSSSSASSSASSLEDGRRLLLLSADAVHVAFVSRLRGRSSRPGPFSGGGSGGLSSSPVVDLVCVARLGLPPPMPSSRNRANNNNNNNSNNLSSSATTTSSPPSTPAPRPAARPAGALALAGCGETAAWVVDAAGRPHALPLSCPALRARGLAAAGEAEAAVAVAERGGLGVPSGCAGGISSFCCAAAAAAAAASAGSGGGGGGGAAAATTAATAAATRLGASIPPKARASLWRSAGKLVEALDVLEASAGLLLAKAEEEAEEEVEEEEEEEEEVEEGDEDEKEEKEVGTVRIPWGAAADEAISSSSSSSSAVIPQFDASAALACLDDALALASAAWASGDAAETSRALRLALAACPALASASSSSSEARLLTVALRAARAGMRREASAALCALLLSGRGGGAAAGDPLLSSSSSTTIQPPRSALDLAAVLAAALGGEVPGGAASAASELLIESAGAVTEAALWQRAWKGAGARAAVRTVGERLLEANGGEAAAAV